MPERVYAGLIIVAALGTSLIAAERPGRKTWTFNHDPIGSVPSGFSGQVGNWTVVESQGKHVLAQTAKNDDPVFNLILAEDTNVKDLELNVQLRPIAGEFDRGGGLVWRARDARNYYVARYNPLEHNFRVYKVEDGKRTMFQSAETPSSRADGWHSLHVTMIGDHMTCDLDGKRLLDVHDATFPNSGKIGLWSKADAQTEFDDLMMEMR
jgi:hypothetical protein